MVTALLLAAASIALGSANREPPQLRRLPPVEVRQNSPEARVLDLWTYVTDPDTSKATLLFSLVRPRKYQYEGGANLTIAQNRYVIATPSRNWVGDETWSVEVSDGDSSAYALLQVSVVSSQAGRLVEAEDDLRVTRVGEWVEREHEGARFLLSNRPGDRLVLRFDGSSVAARVWTGDLRTTERYYEGRYEKDRYGFLSDWKTYQQGGADVLVDGKSVRSVDFIAQKTPGWNELLLASEIEPGESRAPDRGALRLRHGGSAPEREDSVRQGRYQRRRRVPARRSPTLS